MRSKARQEDCTFREVYFDLTLVGRDDEPRPFSWWIAALLIIFGISSWIAINGLWMELPIFVKVLPEGWNLPAYLSIIVQLANVAPLLYVLLTRVCPSFGLKYGRTWFLRFLQPPERLANFIILIVGLIASLLLIKFWDAVVLIPGLPPNAVYGKPATPEAMYGHSLGLFVLTFALGTVDCMSSVTFLAYLAHMPGEYAGALLLGETASGLLPSLYALGQGVKSDPVCIPSDNHNGTIEFYPVQSSPNFGVPIFMGLVAGTTGLSLLAFVLIDCLPNGLGRSVTWAYQNHCIFSSANARSKSENAPITRNDATGSRYLLWICLLLTGYTNCLTNGLLPSMQSYSTASYSTTTFHLAVTLSGIAAPITALVVTVAYGHDQLGQWMRSVLHRLCCRRRNPTVKESQNCEADDSSPQTPNTTSSMASIVGDRLALILVTVTAIGSVFAGYITYLAAASPFPPSLGGLGPAFSVLAWVLMTIAFGIQKAWITLYLVKHGSHRSLRALGVACQIGSAAGALISFLLAAIFKVFVSKPACT